MHSAVSGIGSPFRASRRTRHGGPGDVNLGRRFLEHDDDRVKLAAIGLVSRFGDSSDGAALLKLAKAGGYLLKLPAAQAALKVSGRAQGIIQILLESGDV